jgi:pyruvate/2-oxoglutarate dehydrogenase complex dihydrolipoamide acyltransferase (E2) component
MAYELKLPDLGEGLTEGEIARWLVTEGQNVAEDDPLVEVQTDKTTVEIPSPASGTVTRILVEEGQVVPVGTVLVMIGGDGSDGGPQGGADQPPAEPARDASVAAGPGVRPGTRPTGTVRATPLVRRVAQELGVDLETVTGTGSQGRITETDVRNAAGPGAPAGGTSRFPRDSLPGSAARTGRFAAGPEGRREPLRGVRRLIAEHMARAHREVPAVTWVEECDFSQLGLELLVPTTLKACAEALQEYPELNARLDGDAIVYLDRYDLGVAVQTEQGLVVPVVRDCATRSIDELRADVERLADAARAGRLAPEELRGSTFTVSSAGKLGGLLQTPIVNHPEVAILSIGRIADRPVVRDGDLVAARIGYLSLTFDHRVVDGARAAAFGLAVIRRLEASA